MILTVDLDLQKVLPHEIHKWNREVHLPFKGLWAMLLFFADKRQADKQTRQNLQAPTPYIDVGAFKLIH